MISHTYCMNLNNVWWPFCSYIQPQIMFRICSWTWCWNKLKVPYYENTFSLASTYISWSSLSLPTPRMRKASDSCMVSAAHPLVKWCSYRLFRFSSFRYVTKWFSNSVPATEQQKRQWLRFIFNDNVPAVVRQSLNVCVLTTSHRTASVTRVSTKLALPRHWPLKKDQSHPYCNCTRATDKCRHSLFVFTVAYENDEVS